MAPYWSPGSAAPGAAGRARRASSAGSSSGVTAAVLGRKTSSAGEAYHRVVTGTSSSTRNPLYGMHGLGLADSVAGSGSDDTSASSASASRHYVDPWDLENFIYLKRHWAAEDAEGEASSTPALETAAQSDFYYVGPGLNGEVELDMVDMPVYRPDSVLLADEPLSLSVAHPGHALLNAVEEESFFNERYDPSRHHRLVRRSHSAAATYLHQHREEPRAASAAASMVSIAARNAHGAAYNGRRRSVACAPRYYRTPITGGGEYSTQCDAVRVRPGVHLGTSTRHGQASNTRPRPSPYLARLQEDRARCTAIHRQRLKRTRAGTSAARPKPGCARRSPPLFVLVVPTANLRGPGMTTLFPFEAEIVSGLNRLPPPSLLHGSLKHPFSLAVRPFPLRFLCRRLVVDGLDGRAAGRSVTRTRRSGCRRGRRAR